MNIYYNDCVFRHTNFYASKFGTQQWPQDWKRSVFIPTLKKGNAKECSNYKTIERISHASNGEGDGTLLQYSYLENLMDGGAR